nr:FAD-dependent oxidoreductase [Tessaracoccus coleopterorum]
MTRHRVVVIGSGFGGLFAAKALKHADVDVTLIAKTTSHLFQPCSTRWRPGCCPRARSPLPPARSCAASATSRCCSVSSTTST